MRGIQPLHTLSKRCYAAARRSASLTQPLPVVKPSSAAIPPPGNVQVSKLPNGLMLASLENNSPMSSVGVFVKAGSRNETVGNQGVSHVLRLASGLTTKGVSAFKLCRGMEALGSSLSVTSSRETMVYNMDCLRDNLADALEYLVNVSTAPEFRQWEVDDLTARVKIDNGLARECPQIVVIEKLHEAGYKNALSNSLYCPEYMVGHVSPQQLMSFVDDNFTTGKMAVVGLGVKHSVLRQVAEGLLSVRPGAGAPAAKSLYRGGELRVQNNDDLVHALITSEGGVTGSAEANAFTVLQRFLGAGPHVKRGSNITSQLSRGIAKATTQPFDATAFNASYSDSGLFGVYTISQAHAAGEVIKAAMDQVSSVAEGNMSEEEFTRAKNQVKADYLMSLETSQGLMEEIGAQILHAASYQLPDTVLQTIDNVTHDDVIQAAKRFVDGNKTMASCGNLINTPFVDEV